MQKLTSLILPFALVLFTSPAFAQDDSNMDDQNENEVQEQMENSAESTDDSDHGMRENEHHEMDSAGDSRNLRFV